MGRAAPVLLLLALSAWAEDPSASLEWEPGLLGAVYYRDYPLAPSPPEGVKPPPDIADGRFGFLELADGVRVAIAHEAGGAARGLWVDTDLDGDLAEETPTQWTPYRSVARTTDTALIPLPGESEPLSVMFYFQRRPDVHDRVGVVSSIRRSGWIEIGGRLRPVALVDGNGDLRFADKEHDRVYLDLDGDGELRGGANSYEMLSLGEAFALGREGYAAEVSDPLGARVMFRRLPKAPAPRKWIVPPEPPPIRHLGEAPKEPFADLLARFDEKDLATAARYGTPESFRLLLRVAEKGAGLPSRAEAVREMGYAEYVDQAPEVARLAREHPEIDSRRAAVAALHAMGAPLRAKVYEAILKETKDDGLKDLVEDAARYLAYFGTKQSRAALLGAFHDQSSRMLRLQILQGGTEGDPAGPQKDLLEAALASDGDVARYQALEDYGRLREPKARAAAIDVLASREDMILGLVKAAVRILGREPDKAAVHALLPWAQRGNNEVWREIYDSLRLARDPEVTRAIADGLRDPGLRTRTLCADLLAGMHDPVAAPALLKAAAKEKDPDAAGRIVGALGAQENVPVDALLKLAGRADFPARGDVLALLARIGTGDPAVLRFFRGALASRSPEDRILALDVAATTHDASFAPAILACLGHEAWQVRLAAVEALRGVRVREAVLPLIERLDREESARVRAAIAETLFNLTGEDLLDVADSWHAWWKDHGETFAVPEKPPVRKAEEGGTVARFYGLPVRTERVCFVLDRSESMEGLQGGGGPKRTRLEVAVEQLLAAVKRLPDRARVNALLFDAEVEGWKKSLAQLSDANRKALESFLAKQAPKGKTNLFDALQTALLTDGVDTIFLLSDGDPTAGYYRETSAVLAAVRRLNQTRRIAIFTVAIGRDSQLLRRLAEENGGTYARR